jgi:hypothetical protein
VKKKLTRWFASLSLFFKNFHTFLSNLPSKMVGSLWPTPWELWLTLLSKIFWEWS